MNLKELRIFDGGNEPDAQTWIREVETFFATNQISEEMGYLYAHSRLSPRVQACIRSVGACMKSVTEKPWVWNWSRLKEALLRMEAAGDVAFKVAKVATVGALACIAGPALMTAGLGVLGFSAIGPVAGSVAAGIQSTVYGGAVGAGSLFAFCQSLTMGGAGAMAIATGVSGAGGLAAGAVKEIMSKPFSTSWNDGDNFQPSVTVIVALLNTL
ncbi:hypothetical protein ACEPAH_8568 [Sanghuangporus vaninii]